MKGMLLPTVNTDANCFRPCEQKRQVKVKLRQLQKQSQQSHGWHYWQQQVLPKAMGYGFHLIDTLLIVVAIAMEFFKECQEEYCKEIRVGLVTWNAMVLGVYGMIALGEVRLPWRRGDNIGCGFLFKGVVFVDVGC